MNKMESQLTGMWVSFFTTAGIPSDVAATYALTFAENRIQNDMLLDLNKEYLRDMGISRMGDVIAILRHAKQVHESAARDRVLAGSGAGLQAGAGVAGGRVPVAAVAGRLTTQKPASPAVSRILEHYTRNSPGSSPPKQIAAKRPAVVATAEPTMEIKKTRMIRFAKTSKASETDGGMNGANKTVFARLGNSDTKISMNNPPVKPVFSRLGSKTDKVELPPPVADTEVLQYAGVLKTTPVKKVMMVTASKDNRKIAVGTMRADERPLTVKEKLAQPTKAKSVKFSNKVEYKEIDRITKPQTTQVFNKPERRLSMPEVKNTPAQNASVKARLGMKKTNNLTITKTVFNRLGV